MKRLVLFLFIVSSLYLNANIREYKYSVKVYYPVTVKWVKRNNNALKLMLNGFDESDAYESKYYSNTMSKYIFEDLNSLLIDLNEIIDSEPQYITRTYSKIRQGSKTITSYKKIKIAFIKNNFPTPFAVYCDNNFEANCKLKILQTLAKI